MDNNKNKTTEYQRRAVDRYQQKKDMITVATEKGTRDRIRAKYGDGVNVAEYVRGLIEKDLTGTETGTQPQPQPQPLEDPADVFKSFTDKK